MNHLLSLRAFWTPARAWVAAHTALSIIIVITVGVTGFFVYKKMSAGAATAKYVLATVERKTLIATVSGSGQVSPHDQVDIKPKASGEITSIAVKEGQVVSAGQALAYIDSKDARKSVRDAQANLESAQIAYKKLVQPADALSLTQTQNSVTNAATALATSYSNAANDITSAFLNLPDIMTGLQNIVTGTETNHNAQWNIDFYKNAIQNYSSKGSTYRDDAYNTYVAAKIEYDAALSDFKAADLTSTNTASVEKLLAEAYKTTQTVSAATKNLGGFVQFYEDILTAQNQTPSSVADSELTDIASFTSTLNSHLSSLLADINQLTTNKQSITTSKQSLDKLEGGADPLDLQSSQLSVTKARNALQDAEENLANYTIRAPFSGTIGKLTIVKGDQASTGTSVATIITKDQIAELSLNEVDAARISVGQKATLTFDAINGLSIAGTVASLDTLGTVSQGVVTYALKINFTTQDVRVKPGMSVNADIITDSKADVLSVPSGAVKTQGDSHYVLVVDNPPTDTTSSGVTLETAPRQATVTPGISNDTETEIVDGVSEGMTVVQRTVSGTTQTTTQAPSLFGAPGGARGASGGATRFSR